MDTHLIIVLLTIAVLLLSVMMITVLVVLTLLVVKLRRIATQISHITDNVASATDWFAPAKLISELVSAFRK